MSVVFRSLMWALCGALFVAATACTWGERETVEISGEQLEERFSSDGGDAWSRGAGDIGEACRESTDCFSALCVGGFCTQDCTAAVCPAGSIYDDDGGNPDREQRALGSQCTVFLYPCEVACAGAAAPARCQGACEEAEAKLCMHSCEREADCAPGTDCVRGEDNTYSCQPWEPHFYDALACLAFRAFAGGRGSAPVSCRREEEVSP